MKNILGLDLGTNSIGWALIQTDDEGRPQSIVKLGSRIIPMSQDTLGKFDSGVTESSTSERTRYRSMRRIRERYLLRRERLHRVLHVLGFLPMHYNESLGWDKTQGKTYGKFLDNAEPKLAWTKDLQGKSRFIFMDSFTEMVRDFQKHQPELLAGGKSIPMDWTLYYLRDKALRAPISRQELAWILLNFNQKRGYYQLRGEEEETEDNTKLEEYYVLKVVSVEETEEKRGKDPWYNITLENGWVYRRSSRVPLTDWVGKTREFIVTTQLNEDGSVKIDKEGKERRSFRAPQENDWTLQKKRTEADIATSGETVGSYIYHHLLTAPDEKVQGKLVRTIERKFYKDELLAILQKQSEYIPELKDAAWLEKCILELYARNEAHQESLRRKDMTYLLIEDLIFYQRPLKSKKSLISNCPYESYDYVDKETGEVKVQHIKCIAKSNPYYQEFRLWQFVQNLRLFDRTTLEEKDVTAQYLPTESDYVRLFLYLNDRKDITQDILLKDFFGLKKPKGKDCKYPIRWNYVEDKLYPCNETRHLLLSALKKADVPSAFIDNGMEYRLWHLLYSVEDRGELIKALTKWAETYGLPESFVDSFKKIPSFKKEYGAYSEKAVKKLLSVMRMGQLWSEEALPADLLEQLGKRMVEEKDEALRLRVAKHCADFHSLEQFRGLPVWLACYVVYGRHSEAQDTTRWKKPEDIKAFLHDFKQYSLRNPIVEQCVLETLRTVHDIWEQYGQIDEVHVELGRSMKSTADQRKRMSQTIQSNENTNLRIKQLLMELKSDPAIADVRPHSPMQQDILRIYEEGALQELRNDDPDYDDISRISSLASPTAAELLRYKLWLEQKYRSPYTGKPISLTKLFTPAYQIEHVIPKARFFDDSFTNKVICEAEVNQLKSSQLGYEFIKNHGGQIVTCPTLGEVTVLTKEDYEKFVSEHYAHNRAKARKLMMDDIPEEFIQRQMNDSRYISKVIKGLLSCLVREEDEVEAISKNVIPCTGGITDKLKKDWGLNDVWNSIVSPRFQRMNELTGSDAFGHWEDKEGKRVFQTSMPLELQRGFSKKRIDHRHHAMDALVIALASRNIVSYLNNESARDTQRRQDLKQQLCGKGQLINKPWDTFTQDAMSALEDIVVSFKHYVRIINKASNYYEHYDEKGQKKTVAQKSEGQWAIRQSLHDQYVFAHVNLQMKEKVKINKAAENIDTIVDRRIRQYIINLIKQEGSVKKALLFLKANDYCYDGRSIETVECFYMTDNKVPQSAMRRNLDSTFNKDKILKITDKGIQSILLCYLEYQNNDPSLAFSPEGVAELNANIAKFNKGRAHKPILKVRVYEALGAKFPVGTKNAKRKMYVQGAPHLYMAVYEDAHHKRSYETLQLEDIIERLKLGYPLAPEYNAKGHKLLFTLTPNDIVYVPADGEIEEDPNLLNRKRMYKFVSAEASKAYFVPCPVASPIRKAMEFESHDKSERVIECYFSQENRTFETTEKGQMIKAVCWKLEVDRLGNITKIIR